MNEEKKKEIDRAKAYMEFQIKHISPKVEEIINALTSKERKKLQKELLSIIRSAGFDREAKRMKAFMNV